MNDALAGAQNLAAFIAATAGSAGTVAQLRGGVGCAGVVGVPNGYVNGVVRTDASGDPGDLLEDAARFFSTLQRRYVVWALRSDEHLCTVARSLGGEPTADTTPAMAIRSRIDLITGLTTTAVDSAETMARFGDLAERGYAMPGMSWLIDQQARYELDHSIWAITSDGDQPLGVAAGYLAGATGGVYYVATPPEFRGRGVAAAATAAVVNHLFDRGAEVVTLQASSSGYPVYQRLGFHTYDEYERFTFAPRDVPDPPMEPHR